MPNALPNLRTLWPVPRGRSLPWPLGIAGLIFSAVALAYAYYIVFSRKMGDDEGYLMLSVRGFLEGYPLYDSVFSHYGPFYYCYQWCVRTLLSVPLTHDATRLLCIFHWLAAALVLGVAGGIIMRSTLGGFFIFMQAVVHLTTLANEPGHPQELVVLLLAGAVLVTTVGMQRRAIPELLAVIGAALVCTKVNVGIFFCIALGLTLRCHGTGWWARGVSSWLVTGFCAVLPFWLMRDHIRAEWCRNYALLASATILAALCWAGIVSNRFNPGLRRYLGVGASFALALAAFLGLIVLHGTSWPGLFNGLIATPLKMSAVSLLPKALSNTAVLNAGVAAACALLAALGARKTRLGSWLAAGKAVYGVAGALWLFNNSQAQFDYLLPWVWLVLVPAQEETEEQPRQTFPRVFLCLASAWLGLQAYPIAGTQVALATLLLVVVYTVCLGDALKDSIKHLTPQKVILLRPFTVVVMLYFFANVWCQPHHLRRYYACLDALDLPGARQLRLPAGDAQMYRTLTQYLAAKCDTFLIYPGVNSFYFWSGKRPPTQWNSTGWGLFSQGQQRQILVALDRADRRLILVHEAMVRSWQQRVPPEIQPLVRHVFEDCQEVDRVGSYIIYAPKARRSPTGDSACLPRSSLPSCPHENDPCDVRFFHRLNFATPLFALGWHGGCRLGDA